VEEGRVIVHGVPGGGRNRNAITWTIEEDRVAKTGIPRHIELPLIITLQDEGRFCARVTVKAHYGFWRGALARSIPVLGKNDQPLYFDPPVMLSLATMGVEKGLDGKPIVENGGEFDQVDLAELSSFKNNQKA
jgi:hypothetical protein